MAFLDGSIKSDVLGMRTGISLVLPFDISDKERNDYPVLYLLHGLSDDRTCWWRYTSVERYANEHGYILVIPEVQRSFYTDMERGLNYFAYISNELPQKVERILGIKHKRESTFIAGLSMGGYGALKCGFSRPDFYGGCAGFSPALDKKRFSDSNELMCEKEIRGIFGDELKENNDIICLAERLAVLDRKFRPKIYTSCGFDDFVYEDSRLLNNKLDSLGIEHRYEEWPGTHEWGFWDKSVRHAMKYFLK